MAELTMERRLEILRSLGSPDCGGCGGKKKAKMSHCRNCYFALPSTLRKALYQPFGGGYEEAYEESLSYLEVVRKPSNEAEQIQAGDIVEYENDYGETITAPVIEVEGDRVTVDHGICTMTGPSDGMRIVGKFGGNR